jgi:hypothetical protein
MAPVGAPHAPLPAGADADAGAPATVPAPEPKDALRRFLIRIGCKALYGPLKEIGVDQAKLYRMSNYDEERLDKFMVKLGVLVPEMTPFMRLMLSDEIRGLAPIVVE